MYHDIKTHVGYIMKNIIKLGLFVLVAIAGRELSARTSLVGSQAPDFVLDGRQEGNPVSLKLSDLAKENNYTIVMFYPADFSYVCPTELHAFQEALPILQDKKTAIVAISKDDAETHARWLATPKDEAGVQGVTYPLLSDVGLKVANLYDAIEKDDAQESLRALYVIDANMKIRGQFVYEGAIGRSTTEVVRLLDALIFHDTNGAMCPANWKKGKKGVQENAESVSAYLKAEEQGNVSGKN